MASSAPPPPPNPWSTKGCGRPRLSKVVDASKLSRDDAMDMHINRCHMVHGSPHLPADLPGDHSMFSITIPAIIEMWAREVVQSHLGIGKQVGHHWMFDGRPAVASTFVGVACACYSRSGKAELVHTLRVIVERAADPGKWRIVSVYPISDV